MEHILVVDDNPANRKLLNRLLTAKGYAVTEADSGSSAMELFRAADYDLVLMDILMPGMDGHEATAQIKAFSGEHHTPVIFVTALSSDEAYTQSLAAGGDDFLSKPINATILEAKIKAHLRIKELSRRLEAQNQLLDEHNQWLTQERELVKHLFEEVSQRNFKHPDCIKHHITPMSAFNGDLLLVERGPGGKLYLLLGDFTGHGLAAALGTFPVTQVFFDMAQAGSPVGDMARELNRQLMAFLPSNMFFCATLVQASMLSGELLVWSGGQPDAYIIRAGTNEQISIRSRHMPLGVLDSDEFDPTVEVMGTSPADRLYLYTDGVIEATNPQGEAFGEARLRELLSSGKEPRLQSVIEQLWEFRGQQAQEDDISLVEVNFSCCDTLFSQPPSALATAVNTAMPFSLSITLTADEMREQNPVNILSEMLGAIPAIARHKDLVNSLLTEVYSNALEHSILGLGSIDKGDDNQFLSYYREREERLSTLMDASIRIDVRLVDGQTPRKLEITMEDNGQGFSRERLEAVGEKRHGWGVRLLESLCEEVNYSEDGRRIRVCYRLD